MVLAQCVPVCTYSAHTTWEFNEASFFKTILTISLDNKEKQVKKMDGSSFHDWKGQQPGHYPCQIRIGSIHQTKENRCQNFNLQQVNTCWIGKKNSISYK